MEKINLGNQKTSRKRKKLSTKSKKTFLVVHDPYAKELADAKLIKKAIVESLVDGDLESVRDLLVSHLITVNKLNLSAKTKVDRQTIDDLMDTKKEFNPTLKTLSSILLNITFL